MTKQERNNLEQEVYFVQGQAKRVREEQERRAISLMDDIEETIKGTFGNFSFEEGFCNLLVESRNSNDSWEEFINKLDGECDADTVIDQLDELGILKVCQEYLET